MTAEWQVRTGGIADLDLVGPLWIAVHHQHSQTMPQLAPYVSDDETWRVRQELYEELLAKTDTLLLLAFAGDAVVGYGLAHVLTVDETWIPDTWETSSRIGEIEIAQCATGIPWQRIRLRTAQSTRAAPARNRRAGPDPGGATRQHRRNPLVRTARLPTDLALPVAVRG
jgi:hypothetical protein